ncbi:hypothetical protein JKF63_06194 [Porcisia hertigi]|uniref:Uncharacterized protein n=1 Tax=Porcisia hertigi TaxID=2761500 RepID=A0A836ICE5_9TRYP|nr:hypothetical protein JKF63_06194 [Porcisia hertigi]
MTEPSNQLSSRAETEVLEDQHKLIHKLCENTEQLSRRCRHLENDSVRKRVVIDGLREHVAHLEALLSKTQREMAYAQQQLEFVVISLEKQHGIVADHTEQLRLFAGESTHRGHEMMRGTAQRPFLLLIGNWLYTPLVYFAKGVYSLFSPIITTVQSLSLLNSDVLQRKSGDSFHWDAARKGDLLGMLQRGSLDPDSTSNRR